MDETDSEWDGFETFGNIVDADSDCLFPGDIIQFTKIKITYEEGGFTYNESMYHHTAIIKEVKSDNELVIIHQNSAQHGRKVGDGILRLDSVTSGKLTFFRPTGKD